MNRRYIHYLRELFGLVSLLFKIFIPYRKLQILSLYFHNPSPSLFESIIRHLTHSGYKFIPLKQFSEIIDNRMLNEKVAIITIDDGWKNNLNLLDIIRKYKVFTTIFITTKSIEEGNFWWEYVIKGGGDNTQTIKQKLKRIKLLDKKEFEKKINELKSNLSLERSALTKEELIRFNNEVFIEIGSHTVNHPILTTISTKEQKKELIESKTIIESWMNKSVNYFSYPNGNYSAQLKIMTNKCGYDLCFTTETSYIDLNKIDKNLIPRRCINDNGGYYEALSKIYGIWQRFLKK